MKKHHVSLKAIYKYVVSASDDNHFLNRLHLAAKIMDLNSTMSFCLRIKKWKRVTVAIRQPWYEFGINFLEKK